MRNNPNNLSQPRKFPWFVSLTVLVMAGMAFVSSCGGGGDDRAAAIPPINDLPAGVVPVLGVTGMDLSPYEKITLQAGQIEVSSVFQPGMDQAALVRSGVDGFWHVRVPKRGSQVDWVAVALDRPRPVALLRLLPRRGNGSLMWRGYKALLQVSPDGRDWTTLATLGIVPWPPDDVWLDFLVLVPEPYEYYRLFIEDMDFVSIARLEFYQIKGSGPALPAVTIIPAGTSTPPSKQPGIELPEAPLVAPGVSGNDTIAGLVKLTIDPATLQVSSYLQAGMDGTALIREGNSGFWHLKTPRNEMPARVTFSLAETAPVRVMRILPRTGQNAQLWNGPTAFVEASAGGEDWQVLAALDIDRDTATDDWMSFNLNLTASYSHYRLSIYDPVFLSLGRLELYTTAESAPENRDGR
jgi:hypothetical protein